MKDKKSIRSIILKIHEILGLSTGIVIFIVAVTGCMWVFKDEIEAIYSEYKFVQAEAGPMLTPTEAKKIARTVIPDREIHGALYGKPNEALEVIFYEYDTRFYQSVFLNPYSGEILKLVDHDSGFFNFVMDGHIYLWLPETFGTHLVRISILIFLIALISGLFLWWPKNKNNIRQRFRFDWKSTTRWRRKNFDLHAITGFYVFSLAFLLAFTGSVMGYDWFYHMVYRSIGGDKTPEFYVPDGSAFDVTRISDAGNPIDRLLSKLHAEMPAAERFEIHYPHNDLASIYVEVSRTDGIFFDSDYLYFDQNTLKEIPTTGIYGKYEDACLSDKFIRMNYDIHIGSIGGIAGKIIAFVASLLIATLPVSGVFLWLGRRKK